MTKKLYYATIEGNREVSRDIYLTTFKIRDNKLDIQPGQFLHLFCLNFPEFHLRRPFTVFNYTTKGEDTIVWILYEKVGRITNYLASCVPRARLNDTTDVQILMPLGVPFEIASKNKRVVLVAGGVGIAAFGILKKKIERDTILLYGARSADYLIDLNLFESPFNQIKYSTDDGSFGSKGFVTLLLEDDLRKYGNESIYYICGPEPMMVTSFFLLKKYNAMGYFSLENKMGCALGACRACVVKIKSDKIHNFKMATCCTEGPNFSIDQFPDTGWW